MRLAGIVLLVGLSAACGRGTPIAGPSPAPSGPKVMAVLTRDGVLLKAHGLDAAHQVEGVIEWTPRTLWYQAFDLGRWWFSTPDWEWVMVPAAGHMAWGIWREEAASGDGVLGVIRFEGMPSVQRLSVWVDGRRVEAETVERRPDELGAGADGLVPASGSSGVRGRTRERRWFLAALGADR